MWLKGKILVSEMILHVDQQEGNDRKINVWTREEYGEQEKLKGEEKESKIITLE